MKLLPRLKLHPALQRWIDAFPLRLNFFLLVGFSITGYLYISTQQLIETSSFISILGVLLKLVLVFAAILLACSFFFTLLPFVLFSHRARIQKDFLNLQFDTYPQDESSNAIANVSIERLTFPLLGSVKLRFYYNDGFRTPTYPLPSKGFSFLFAGKTNVACRLELENVRSYIADSVGVHFEDMFHLFSFSHRYPVNRSFYTFPKKVDVEAIQPSPTTAKETNVRTEVVRRVEGEMLFFKDFEPSDDIRRIIWKIYAKNRELVVRVPEMRNPYASEITFLASYHNSMLSSALNAKEMDVFLNRYKHMAWSIFSELQANKELSLKLLSDQQLGVLTNEYGSQAQHLISASRWQNSTPVSQAYNAGSISVLLLSSLTDADDVQKLAGKLSKSTTVVLCRFSQLFDKKGVADYARMLFVKPRQGGIDKPLWQLSPTRARLAGNEQKIEELLTQSDATLLVADV